MTKSSFYVILFIKLQQLYAEETEVSDMPVLEIQNFSKTYKNGKRAVDGLSLSIESGDTFGFIGHNGA